MEKYKYQTYFGVIGDAKNLEIHFAEMASQGWMIDKIGAMVHVYRAITPSKKRFVVDFLMQITSLDYPDNEDAQEYRRRCEELGWTFVTANKQMNVFCADDEAEPKPIHTSNKTQAEAYLKMCRKYELFGLIFPALIFGFMMIFQWRHVGVEMFLSDLITFLLLGFLLFSVGYVWNLVFVLLWYRRTKKSAKLDLPLPVVNYTLSRIRMKVFGISLLSLVLGLIVGMSLEVMGGMSIVIIIPATAGLVAGLLVRHRVNKKERGRESNFAFAVAATGITIVIVYAGMVFGVSRLSVNEDMADNIPVITLYNLGISQEPHHISFRSGGSVLVPIYYAYWEDNRQGSVHTEVHRSFLLARALYNRFAIEGQVLTAGEAEFWGADEGIIYIAEGTIRLILLRDDIVLRARVSVENIEKEVIAQAVRNLLN